MREPIILITGVAGLIGSRFANHLLRNKNTSIIGIDDLSGGYIDNVPTDVYFQTMNIVHDNIENIFKNHKIDYIYHFAAYAAEGLSPFMRQFNYETNLIATARLVNMAIKYDIKKFIFTSSMAVYGDGNPPFEERDQPNPIDPYGISKLACELDLKVANAQHNLNYTIIRPHNVYGVNQNIWDKYRNVLGIWIRQILNDESISIYGDGLQKRAFTYIDDIVEPLWNAMIEETNGEIINLGGIKPVTILEAAETLIEVVGHGKIKYFEARHEVKDAFSTCQKSIDLLKFKQETTLKEGFKKMWDWAKEQPNRPVNKWKNYEIEKGMYEYWK